MIHTLAYIDNKPVLVTDQAYHIIKHNMPTIGTDLMANWANEQGAVLCSTANGLRLRVNTNNGYSPEAA